MSFVAMFADTENEYISDVMGHSHS